MSGAAERDRILSRVRTTTAVTGVGAVLAGGLLAGWLGLQAGSSTPDGGTAGGTGSTSEQRQDDDGGLTAPGTLPGSGGDAGGQPPVTSGGS